MTIISKISEILMMPEENVLSFALTMPLRYKKYKIPKRNSNELRLIAQPSKEAKFIQRIIVTELREILPVHSAAQAYEKKSSILKNAQHHNGSRYLLKMDFKNFFPSITPELFFLISEDCGINFKEVDRTFLEHALFFRSTRRGKLRLSIGAPSSPFISNFVMNQFDSEITNKCTQEGISYTRYADDLTFSTTTKSILFEIPDFVKDLLIKKCHRKLIINSKKTIFSSKAHNRHTTGIVLTNDNKLSIGRKRKREIYSLINSFRFGTLDEKSTQRLKGLISHAHHIEPNFIPRIKSKYNSEVIDKILNSTQRK